MSLMMLRQRRKYWKRPDMKITLDTWAKQRFDPPPHVNTLRAWARDGKIIPAPVKIGRAYFVEAKAMHVEEVIRGGVMG